mgnify:FL=1
MLRSIYSAVSGIRAHQTKMDVIGNNIANINTVGYKKQYVTFQDLFSQMISSATSPSNGRGGTNPKQIGLGVGIGAINTIHTEGSAQRTDNPEDLMIDGEGFFVVTADTNYENRFYTRAGNFTLDKSGNLVTPDGYKVLGYKYSEDGELTSVVAPIQIKKSETAAPVATSELRFNGNLDSRLEEGDSYTVDSIVKDSLGNSYTVTFKFTKGTSDNTGTVWTLSLDRITDQSKGYYTDFPRNDINPINQGNSVTLKFDKNGKLIYVGDGTNIGNDENQFSTVKLNLTGLVFDKGEGLAEGETVPPDGNFGKDKTGEILIFDGENIDELVKNLTQFANDMDAKPYAEDGNSSGKLEGYAVDSSGTVVGIFSNGEKKVLAQIMLAKFDNPMGLQKMGGNLFIDTRNSGEPQYGFAGGNGYGSILSGTLEMSNVDLSMEFTEMITTQRGFQANSRIITTSDEMLQELVNLKR